MPHEPDIQSSGLRPSNHQQHQLAHSHHQQQTIVHFVHRQQRRCPSSPLLSFSYEFGRQSQSSDKSQWLPSNSQQQSIGCRPAGEQWPVHTAQKGYASAVIAKTEFTSHSAQCCGYSYAQQCGTSTGWPSRNDKWRSNCIQRNPSDSCQHRLCQTNKPGGIRKSSRLLQDARRENCPRCKAVGLVRFRLGRRIKTMRREQNHPLVLFPLLKWCIRKRKRAAMAAL